MRMKVSAVVLSLLLVYLTLSPALLIKAQGQQPSQETVVLLAQQAQVIRPGDPRFSGLSTQFAARMGLSGHALAAAFLSGPLGSATQLGNGIVYYPLLSSQGLDMRLIAGGQQQTALLGILHLPQGATLAGGALPQRVGVAAMAGSLVLVLIDLTTGQIIAFISLPAALILAFFFFPVLIVIQVVVQLIFIPVIGFPFPIFPIFLACPALPNMLPVHVTVGSGALLLSLPGAFELREGDISPFPAPGQPTISVRSLGPSVQYSLLSPGTLQLGFIGGGATAKAELPISTPFRLLVQGGGKTACMQAVVIPFGFTLIISGTISYD
jgi:hypothetical protein